MSGSTMNPCRRRNLKLVDAFSKRRKPVLKIVSPTPTPISHTGPKSPKSSKSSKARTPPSQTCMICFEAMGSDLGQVSLGCGHQLCASCLAQHSRRDHRCPYCREPFAPPAPNPTTTNTGIGILTQDVITDLAESSVDITRSIYGDNFGMYAPSARRTTRQRRQDMQRLLANHAQTAIIMVSQFLEDTVEISR
jgi:hypothetical protein